MDREFSSINDLMETTNQLMLSYVLRKHCSGKPSEDPETLLSEKRKVFENLEKETDKLFRALGKDEMNLDLPTAAMLVDTFSRDVDKAELVEFRLGRIRRFKDAVIRYTHARMFELADSYIDPVSSLLKEIAAHPIAFRAFPCDTDEASRKKREHEVRSFTALVNKGGPERIVDYIEAFEGSALAENDLLAGSNMLKALSEGCFFWGLSPWPVCESKAGKDLVKKLEARHGSYNVGYGRLMVQLEEMNQRLASVDDDWKEVLAHVFSVGYSENLGRNEPRLQAMLDNMGSGGLLEKVDKGNISIPNILMQISVLGPLHLEMVRRYTGIFIQKIAKEAFKEKHAVVGKYRASPQQLISVTPHTFVQIDRKTLDDYQFIPDEIEVLGNDVFGIRTSYLQVPLPLKPVDKSGKVPKKVKKHDGDVFYGERIEVIDLFSVIDAPAELIDAYLASTGSGCGECTELEKTGTVPAGLFQVRRPEGVYFDSNIEDVIVGPHYKDIDGVTVRVSEVVVREPGNDLHEVYRQHAEQHPERYRLVPVKSLRENLGDFIDDS